MNDGVTKMSPEHTTDAARELWVFGYGSLMWRPGFPHVETHRARLAGFSRCFCVYSVHHRGRKGRPGIVLGLDRGGTCDGMVFRVPDEHAASTLAYLRERELVYGVYRETWHEVSLLDDGGRIVRAVTYIAERAHPSFAGRQPVGKLARLIRGAEGVSGPNIEYLVNTVRQLTLMQADAGELRRILSLISPYAATAGDGAATRARCLAMMRHHNHTRRRRPPGPRITLERLNRFLFRMRIAS
ncbi:MAG TPA: gamma-glutamylcyclotransferase [Hyphomicrobiaceae bacterium]|nr:gamma-glutamylcyclotransferase [Hyphomicrobiaceae bacterium]